MSHSNRCHRVVAQVSSMRGGGGSITRSPTSRKQPDLDDGDDERIDAMCHRGLIKWLTILFLARDQEG